MISQRSHGWMLAVALSAATLWGCNRANTSVVGSWELDKPAVRSAMLKEAEAKEWMTEADVDARLDPMGFSIDLNGDQSFVFVLTGPFGRKSESGRWTIEDDLIELTGPPDEEPGHLRLIDGRLHAVQPSENDSPFILKRSAG